MKYKKYDLNYYFFIFKFSLLIIIIIILMIIYIILFLSNEKISIIIPTYNREKLIIQSLKNILNQTYHNFEAIVIDDGSTDNTEKAIYKLKDKRIRYIKLRKNKGSCIARNIGIKKATGKYITFQDSDDLLHFDKLQKQLNNLIKHKSDFDFCKFCIHYNSKFKKIFPEQKQEKNILNKNILNELCNGNFITTQSILVKKSYIEKFLFDPKFPRLQDYDLVLRIIPYIKISYTNEVLVDLYRQKDSISRSLNKYKEAFRLLFKKKYNIKCNKKSKFYNIFKSKIL